MKPQLLLHICCAPDEAWVINTLKDEYSLRCFFCNPNIQPEHEYQKRLNEASKVAEYFKIKFDHDFYLPQDWEKAIENSLDSPEGGPRCEKCFLLRLRRSAQFCKSIGWDHFTTVMSISPHKRIDFLNNAGKLAAEEFGVIFEPFNFKKNNGFLNSVKLSIKLGLYRQDYCGCRLSKAERLLRKTRIISS